MNEEEKYLVKKAVEDINKIVTKPIRIMEVCGTHTHQIARFGLRSILTPKIKLVSGPGCPVCVTEPTYIDMLIMLLDKENVTIVTFGDLLRVRGSKSSLEEKKAMGKKVISVYSPEEVICLAEENKNEKFIFAAVGFETTTPIYGVLIKSAKAKKINNLFFITSLKRMEPVIRFILERKSLKIDALLCPGHVAAITGIKPFLPVTSEYKVPASICGFEILDLVTSINILCRQVMGVESLRFENAYKSCVRSEGNLEALGIINEVFETTETSWRGIGPIKNSAYKINKNFEEFDALKKYKLIEDLKVHNYNVECDCKSIILGEKTPDMCKSFGTKCTYNHPLGPCMISSEGACAAYYRYGGDIV